MSSGKIERKHWPDTGLENLWILSGREISWGHLRWIALQQQLIARKPLTTAAKLSLLNIWGGPAVMSFRGVPVFTSCFCPQPCPRLSKTGVSIFSLSSCSLISPQFSKKEILLKKKMLKNSSKTSKSHF